MSKEILLRIVWFGVAPLLTAFVGIFLITYPFLDFFSAIVLRWTIGIGSVVLYVFIALALKREIQDPSDKNKYRWPGQARIKGE